MGTSASSANPEAALPLGRFVVDAHVLDASGRTPVATPLDHRLDVVLGTLEDGLDAAVVEVPDPPVDAAFAGRVPRVRAVVDALYPPGDEDVRARSLGHRRPLVVARQKSAHRTRDAGGYMPRP